MITARESATIGAWKSYFPLYDRPNNHPTIQPTDQLTDGHENCSTSNNNDIKPQLLSLMETRLL